MHKKPISAIYIGYSPHRQQYSFIRHIGIYERNPLFEVVKAVSGPFQFANRVCNELIAEYVSVRISTMRETMTSWNFRLCERWL